MPLADERKDAPLNATSVAALMERLAAARERVLAHRSVADVLRALSVTVDRFLEPESPRRRQIEATLPGATGFSPEMVRHALPLMFEPLRGDAIGRLLDAEIGGRESFQRHDSPLRIVHILSGNIPALAVSSIALSLAIGSSVMVKESHADRVVPSLFLDALAEVDDELAECAASRYWPGGRLDIETEAFGAADLVVAFGSDATIADIARRVPGRFIGHGHRLSFAVVSRESLAEPTAVAAALAYDISLWDQQGCLSPQVVYVEQGGVIAPERFAEVVGQQLARWASELPPRALSFDEQADLQRFRQAAEWRAVRGDEVVLFTPPRSLQWTVVYDAAPAFAATPLNRTVWIKPLASLAHLPPVLVPVQRYLEGAGVAVPGPRLAELTKTLTRAGVHRVCPLGSMQRPDLTWRHGGRPRVSDWLIKAS